VYNQKIQVRIAFARGTMIFGGVIGLEMFNFRYLFLLRCKYKVEISYAFKYYVHTQVRLKFGHGFMIVFTELSLLKLEKKI
jgi:hypothetical protein